MKTVYNLRDDVKHIADVQEASLSPKPFGLKAKQGLYGSEVWWQNIEEGKIPLIKFKGKITKLFTSGMDYEPCFEMKMADGKTFEYDCVATKKSDKKLFQVGNDVEISFVFHPLKTPIETPTGFQKDVRCLIEIRIQENPTKI